MKWIACATLCLLACNARRPPPSGETATAPTTATTTTAGTATPAPVPPLPFTCDGERCLQRHPAMPDDGDWSCVDSAGATICVGGERPAGVAPAPGDPRWACGARRGPTHDRLGSRICRNAAPAFPDGRMAGWRCRTVPGPPVRRACDRDPEAHTLADPCGPRSPCVDGSRCVDGRCALPAGPPNCWLDYDCLTDVNPLASPPCRIGVCDEGGG